jgi:hypothetical protein
MILLSPGCAITIVTTIEQHNYRINKGEQYGK